MNKLYKHLESLGLVQKDYKSYISFCSLKNKEIIAIDSSIETIKLNNLGIFTLKCNSYLFYEIMYNFSYLVSSIVYYQPTTLIHLKNNKTIFIWDIHG